MVGGRSSQRLVVVSLETVDCSCQAGRRIVCRSGLDFRCIWSKPLFAVLLSDAFATRFKDLARS